MGANNRKILVGALVGIVVLAVALLVSTIVLGVRLNNKSKELKDLKNQPKVCNSPECVKAAGNMIQSMDLSVDPCSDFYQFSCGAWVENNPIPDTSSSWNQFNLLREILSRDVRGILETEISQELDPNPVRMAKMFYRSCMEQNSTDESELVRLIEDLAIEEVQNDFGLGLVAARLRREIGGAFFANMYVEIDEENALNFTIYIDQPSLGINRAFLVDASHPTRQAYRDLIVEVWPIFYPAETNVSGIADEILEFETKLAMTSTPPEQRRNRTLLYNSMTLAEFSAHTSNSSSFINWETYVTEVFKNVIRDHDLELGPLPELTLIVRDPSYFTEFGHVLSQTRLTTIVNYLKWRLIFGLGIDVSDNLRQVFFDFTRKTQGTMYPSPRWKDCSERANAFFGMAVSFHYVQEVFGGDFERQMGEMIQNIQNAVYQTIDNVDWISSRETREKAKEKARKMKEFLGYPEWLLNTTALDFYYKGLTLTLPENHFKNVIEVSYYRNMESLRRLRNAKDINRWNTDPTVVNAFYSSTYNSISFPAGILQPPFYFTGETIQAINYGAVGMVIGHEITHGFDDRGRQSDGDGNLINWWDEGTISNYVEKATCFINQYGEYTAEEANNLKLNGNNTLGENIADNGGLRQSYNAYKAFVQSHGPEPFLPGLEYTPEQLFFVAFAQIWCGAYTAKGMENQILTGVHSPNRFRVKGVLQNSVEFATTWNCPLPDENTRCTIW